ncbi:Peptidyl-prolyl cis-trans isomerase FKBP16-1, chloroplastic [Glycine max]|nr:Peptidyl-prolyl cis-trans isomerase FKBP16-1, chloroplastic [Glycine max]
MLCSVLSLAGNSVPEFSDTKLRMCMEDANLNYAESNRVSILTVDKFSRRMVLQFLGFNHVICYASPALAAPIMPDIKEPEILLKGKDQKHMMEIWLNSIVYAGVEMDTLFSVDQFSGESNPVILPLDENQMIVGLKEVLTGMRVGGKRRALIPPSVGYVNENLQPMPEEFGPRRSLFPHAQ